MEYFYRIHFNDGSKKDFTGKDLVGKKLSAFDKFSTTDEFNVYIDKACNLKELAKGDIKSVNIVGKKENGDQIEYNLIGTNPYFYDVFDNIEEKEVWEYGRYQTIREVISTESNAYQDLRDYLLKELKYNADEFLNEVYKYDGKFKEILTKYAASFTENVNEEEEYHNIYELETAIRNHLTIYQIFRNVATKRYNYEKFATYRNKKEVKQEKVSSVISKEEQKIHDNMLDDYYNKLGTVTSRTNEYNEKYDEFIEPDEYGQMNGYTGGRVK